MPTSQGQREKCPSTCGTKLTPPEVFSQLKLYQMLLWQEPCPRPRWETLPRLPVGTGEKHPSHTPLILDAFLCRNSETFGTSTSTHCPGSLLKVGQCCAHDSYSPLALNLCIHFVKAKSIHIFLDTKFASNVFSDKFI